MTRPASATDRRRLLRFMLQSPLLTGAAGLASWWPTGTHALPERAIPDRAAAALDVFQLKRVAQSKLALPVWHFIMNGADDGKTVAANRAAMDLWQIRVRRLIDVSRIDTSLALLGETLDTPIMLAPIGNQLSIHPDGELASARASGKRRNLMMCSTVSSYAIDEIAASANGPVWFQLYASDDEALNRHLLKKAENAGCRAVVLTIDSPTRGNRQGERWFARQMDRATLRLGNFEDYEGRIRFGSSSLTWEFIDWLRNNTAMKILLKGIVTQEDASLSVKHGVDGLIVSNHGGRQEESGRGTLACLPEVVSAAAELPVLIDGGFRRGTDIFKALALGAAAVCIGRPCLWGLGAFGEEGVARVLSLLQAELKRIMQFAGTPTLADISADHVIRA
ncbi:MAG: alpha-hydroxy acid oxidase [Gammaproteobacteria bacterium]|nr:alpha-hydroxy acid oxidase [Gammaproteobacteria bacterium]